MKASKSWKLPFTAIFHYLKVAMYSCFLPLIEITRYSSRRCMEVKAAKAFFTNTAKACHRNFFLDVGCSKCVRITQWSVHVQLYIVAVKAAQQSFTWKFAVTAVPFLKRLEKRPLASRTAGLQPLFTTSVRRRLRSNLK